MAGPFGMRRPLGDRKVRPVRHPALQPVKYPQCPHQLRIIKRLVHHVHLTPGSCTAACSRDMLGGGAIAGLLGIRFAGKTPLGMGLLVARLTGDMIALGTVWPDVPLDGVIGGTAIDRL